jgi:hypothetical protein
VALESTIRRLLSDPHVPRDLVGWLIANEAGLPELYLWAAGKARFHELPAAALQRAEASWERLSPGQQAELPSQLLEASGLPEPMPSPGSIGLRLAGLRPEHDLRLILAHELGHLLGLDDIYRGSYEPRYFWQPFEHHQALQRLVQESMTPRSVELLRAQIMAPIDPYQATTAARRALRLATLDPALVATTLSYQLHPEEVLSAWTDVRRALPHIRGGGYSLEPVVPLTERIMSEVYGGASPPRLASLMREEVPISPGMGLTARRALPFAGGVLEQVEEPGLARQAGRVGTWLWNVGQFARLAGEVVPSIVAPIAAGALAHQIYKHFIRPRLVSREA